MKYTIDGKHQSLSNDCFHLFLLFAIASLIHTATGERHQKIKRWNAAIRLDLPLPAPTSNSPVSPSIPLADFNPPSSEPDDHHRTNKQGFYPNGANVPEGKPIEIKMGSIEQVCQCALYTERFNQLEQQVNGNSSSNGLCVSYDFDQYVGNYRKSSSHYYWSWQECTEFGRFQTVTSHTSTFIVGGDNISDGVSVDFHVAMCKKLFGIDFTRVEKKWAMSEKVRDARKIFNGITTNILYINGSDDPWHPMSVLPDSLMNADRLNEHNNATTRGGGVSEQQGVRSILINGTSHCQDMFTAYASYYAKSGYAPPSNIKDLMRAQETAKRELKRWLDDSECC